MIIFDSETLTSKTFSPETAFKDALKATRKRGVCVRQNVRTCCRSCTTAEDLGMTEEQQESIPYVWTFGGQGFNYVWRGGDTPVHVDRRANDWNSERTVPVKSIYFNHDNGGGQILAEELRKAGLKVEWSGTDSQCVVVNF